MVVDVSTAQDGDLKTSKNDVPKSTRSTAQTNNNTRTSRPQSYIQIHGQWYDMTSFAPYHPGGPVIYEFAGRDATQVFTAFHMNHESMLKRMKKMEGSPPEKYIALDGELNKSVKPSASSSSLSSATSSTLSSSSSSTEETEADLAFTKDFEDMIAQMHKDGLFKPSMFVLVQKILVTAFFFVLGWTYAFRGTREARLKQDDALIDWSTAAFSAMMIALFFQQSGFLMHEFMHNQWFQSRKIDQAFGRFFGCVCIGLSSLWWRDEHFVHHVFTNTYDDDDMDKRIIDIQLAQDLWAQDGDLLQFFDGSLPGGERKLPFFKLSTVEKIIRAQAFLFLPLTVILGRINIIIASFIKYPHTVERCLQASHVIWFSAMLWASFPTMQSAALFHFLISMGQGVLHIQLLVSHYVKPWNVLKDMKMPNSWYKKQIMTTINIAPLLSTRWIRRLYSTGDSAFWDTWDDFYAPWFDDWFHGGLNLHIEHHTLPMLPRNSLREANLRIKSLCRKHDLYFDERHFFEVVWDTLAQLHQVGQEANFVDKKKERHGGVKEL